MDLAINGFHAYFITQKANEAYDKLPFVSPRVFIATKGLLLRMTVPSMISLSVG
jgi:hypothetical protein